MLSLTSAPSSATKRVVEDLLCFFLVPLTPGSLFLLARINREECEQNECHEESESSLHRFHLSSGWNAQRRARLRFLRIGAPTARNVFANRSAEGAKSLL